MNQTEWGKAILEFQGFAIRDVVAGEKTKEEYEEWLAEVEEEKPETLTTDPMWVGMRRALQDLL